MNLSRLARRHDLVRLLVPGIALARPQQFVDLYDPGLGLWTSALLPPAIAEVMITNWSVGPDDNGNYPKRLWSIHKIHLHDGQYWRGRNYIIVGSTHTVLSGGETWQTWVDRHWSESSEPGVSGREVDYTEIRDRILLHFRLVED